MLASSAAALRQGHGGPACVTEPYMARTDRFEKTFSVSDQGKTC